MNSNPYNPTPIVALALLVLTVVCIAGAVFGNSSLTNPPAWDQAVVASGTSLANTQDSIDITKTVAVGILRQTQVPLQPVPVNSGPNLLTIVIALAVLFLIIVTVIVAATLATYIRKRSSTEGLAANAQMLQAQTQYIESRRKLVEECRQQKLPVATIPSAPVDHPPFMDGGRKVDLDPDSRAVWPDDEENHGKSNLPWVE